MAYILAIFVLLGGLAFLHTHGDLAAMSDTQRSNAASARKIAQDHNAEFSWDMVRHGIRVDLLNRTSTGSYYSLRLQKNLTGTNVFQDVSAPVS